MANNQAKIMVGRPKLALIHGDGDGPNYSVPKDKRAAAVAAYDRMATAPGDDVKARREGMRPLKPPPYKFGPRVTPKVDKTERGFLDT